MTRPALRLLPLAGAAGAMAGLAGVALLTLARAIADRVGHTGIVAVLAPLGAGVLCAVVQRRIAAVTATGVPIVLDAVGHGHPVRARSGAAHFVQTAACLGTGWSGGREGPMMLAGAAVGSATARVLADPTGVRLHLVAAGAAGAVAGAMNTPVTATLLVWSLFLRRGDPVGAIAALAGAVAGAAVHRVLWDAGPLLPAPDVPPAAVGTACAVGAAAAAAALVYGAALRHAPRAGDRVIDSLRIVPGPVLGGLVAAALLLTVPAVGGTGDPVLLGGAPAAASVPALIGMLAAAIAAPATMVGLRGCGGSIGPTLVLGAVVGELVARFVVPEPVAAAPDAATACRLVGMAAVLAAATRLPLMAVAAVVELTGAAGSVPALLVGATVAVVLAGACTTATVFGPAVGAAHEPRRYSQEELR